jgi:hypothetical protein
MTWWTKKTVKELEEVVGYHIDTCPECQRCLESPPPDDDDNDEPYFCPEGEELVEEFSDAETYYSWQHSFPGNDPNYSEFCPCNSCFIQTMTRSIDPANSKLEKRIKRIKGLKKRNKQRNKKNKKTKKKT